MGYKRIFFLFLVFIQSNLQGQYINFSKHDSLWANRTLSTMNIRQKIAQLFMVDFSAKPDNLSRKKAVNELIKKYGVGGVIAMKSDYGLCNEWLREFQGNSKIPLLASIDGEWGVNMRLSGTTKYPYALTLGAIYNDTLLYEMGKKIAVDCKRVGVHINFAPVVDININPNNPVINYRSFGEDKINVTNKTAQYALGMQSQSVMACAKHFPGHGDTDVDSHHDIPVISKTKDVLEDLELYPYFQLIKQGLWSIMVAHLKVPALDNEKTSSLSHKIITDLLKQNMRFDGLVFSDAMNMSGATKSASAGDLELEAYRAGNDILLMSQNVESGIKKIESYVLTSSDSRIAEDLERRVFKILLFKHKLNTEIIPAITSVPEPIHPGQFIQQLYSEAITELRDNSNDRLDKTKNTILISFSDKPTEFSRLITGFKSLTQVRLSKDASSNEIARLLDGTKYYEQVIVSYHNLSQNSSSNFGLTAQQIEFISKINQQANVLHLWFGNPYALKYFQTSKYVLVTYEDNDFTHRALAEKINNDTEYRGVLPVSVGKFKVGNGYRKPEEIAIPIQDTLGLSQLNKSEILARIEKLSNEIVNEGVAPGGQIYVLHKGKEIYNKPFGKHTYSSEGRTVRTTDIYDLASVSKIMGTTIATMKLVEQGKINLTDRVDKYLILDDSNTVSDITIQQLLMHEAGLISFIPFFERFNDSNFFSYFRTSSVEGFRTKVAKDLYVRDDYKDSMWYETTHRERKNIGNYKYSDLSMYILQKVVEVAAKMPLDRYLYLNFYKPMDLGLCYNPTEQYRLERIAPTEFDTKFRLQQVQGYVHDQGCALYGGVCGHAGLFGNAEDVAQILQMLLQGGKYEGKQYLKPETISRFTMQQHPNSRRGLGFDKPNVDDLSSSPTAAECSFATFGHTGFTGTCAWADPFRELVFVFLSNRVYPEANNKKLARGKYRERLQSLFYLYTKE